MSKSTELVWLIEAPHVRPVKYWAGEDWTDDPIQADRFQSKEAADAEIYKHTLLNFDDDGNNRIIPVEHMFNCGNSS